MTEGLQPGHVADGGQVWDVSTPEGLLAYMRETKDEADWGRRCDVLKHQLGDYPNYWYATMILSGEMDRILGQGASEIKLFSLAPDGTWERTK